ncbi:UvrD/REP helicase N-terminal domain-containing protein [Saccharopolyspora shandongensis]|uniref:DNA 3'-5' helicase n=1 Tax=Saccharopolyspora shandongensis TaxID=418495 RepID=A0A1H2ZU38_9PSEU|nr:UvrD-helicase domain-containing protein [Saccharopolyspora shandongensis]SDX20811.1 UvrD/REP helicase N-terminal domain-containing protein [Saccharopolyspora shandongensis]
MTALGLHRDFLPQYAQLDEQVRRDVDEMLAEFGANGRTSLRLEDVAGAKDPRIRVLRIDDAWSSVVVAHGESDSYLLLSVRRHGEALEWARKQRITENNLSGGIELRDDLAISAVVRDLGACHPAESPDARLFDRIPDEELARLGIDEGVLAACRNLRTVDELDILRPVLPELQYDVLADLAAGLSPETVWQELLQNFPRADEGQDSRPAVQEGPGTFTGAMKRSHGHIVVVNDSEELADILRQPFDLWRVFLHPTQRRIAEHPPYKGPTRITGGAGTGKTLVALHRAHHLARNAQLVRKSILLTTYTKNLAEELARNLDLLITDRVVRGRIEVANVDVIALRYFRQRHPNSFDRVPEKDRRNRWQQLALRHHLGFTATFLDQEWRQVVLGQQITTAEQYRESDRRGRGSRLAPAVRDKLWSAFEEFTAQLREENKWAFEEIADEAARVLCEDEVKPYRHVIVDEAQDLHPAHWRMLRALVWEDDDDLFITGDTHQRIYDNKVSLRSLGIRVTGRSTKLRINYRTSREILLWSTALLLGERVDDMDEGEENLVGYRSSFRGREPEPAGFADESAEVAAIVQRVQRWLCNGIPPETIGIVSRTGQFGDGLTRALKAAGIRAAQLGGSARTRGVRIGTMHKMKGLEFRCVVVAAVSASMVPLEAALANAGDDSQQHQQVLQAERNLLFVACTRARDALFVSWHGEPSKFLAPVLSAE